MFFGYHNMKKKLIKIKYKRLLLLPLMFEIVLINILWKECKLDIKEKYWYCLHFVKMNQNK